MITDEDKLACVERELALRRQVYPNLIRKGVMTSAIARRQIELIEAIRDDYRVKIALEMFSEVD